MKSQGSSDVVFVGCTLSSATPGYAEAPAGARRQIVVNGKRVKTVDVHAHCAVPAAMALVGRPLESPALLKDDIPTRLRAMDARGAAIPAAALTAFARDEDRKQSLNAGFQMHLTKPIDRRSLVNAVATLGRQRVA